MKATIAMLAVLALTISCSKVQKAEKNMDDMSSSTKALGGNMDEMKSTTTTMYQQIRSKESEDTRNKKFEILNSKEDRIGAKLAAAAVYFKSFEFQLWTGTDIDSDHLREILFLDAANEFTRKISDIYSEIKLKKMSPTNSGTKHSSEESFYALAATMHSTHHYQDELVSENSKIEEKSFYDIVKRALKKDSEGENLTEFETILVNGINREIMIELIKARVDFLAALGLKNLTDKRNMTFGQKLKAGLFKLTEGKLGSIELPETFSSSNEATKDQTIKYLESALKAKSFLVEIGIDKQLEKTLKSAFSKIKLASDAGDTESESQDQEESESSQDSDDKRVKIQNLINDILI